MKPAEPVSRTFTASRIVGQVDAVGPRRAGAAGRASGRSADDAGEQPLEALDVAREHREHLLLADALAGLDAGVHVGHQGDRGVAHPQLAGEHGLGVRRSC